MNPDKQKTLITGSFQPELEEALAERLRTAKSADPGAPVIVLVGSNILALHLRRALAEKTPLWNVSFFTFAELARTLGDARLRTQSRKPLPSQAETFLVREIIRREDIITLPERDAGIRLATEAEAAAIPASFMSPPQLINNTGQYGEFVLVQSNPALKGDAVMDDWSHDAIT